ncbi:Rz1-like lysis system protein LysC [Novosphingobium sp.]|uniref:Rz1-like lysis system protein LysC n=1 Tax=Novosphingobium sp. TaxID=1874826 RepID=UPI003FA558B7
MPRLRNICLALSLLTCAACSKRSDVASAPPPPAYEGIPAGLMARCTVKDIPLETTADIVTSRGIYKEGFEKCAAKVDAIRAHDAEARAAAGNLPEKR